MTNYALLAGVEYEGNESLPGIKHDIKKIEDVLSKREFIITKLLNKEVYKNVLLKIL